MKRRNAATKSAKTSGGPKIKIREKSVLPKTDPNKWCNKSQNTLQNPWRSFALENAPDLAHAFCWSCFSPVSLDFLLFLAVFNMFLAPHAEWLTGFNLSEALTAQGQKLKIQKNKEMTRRVRLPLASWVKESPYFPPARQWMHTNPPTNWFRNWFKFLTGTWKFQLVLLWLLLSTSNRSRNMRTNFAISANAMPCMNKS